MATRATCDRLPGKIKLLYETAGSPGGYERAVAEGTALALKRQADTFVDFRPSKKTWAVWSWAHHAGPAVINISEITDEHGRFGLTYVGPHRNGPKDAAYSHRRRPRHGDLTITDVIGRQREAPHVWPDGSYTCPFCGSAVSAGLKACPNPACPAGESMSPERARASVAREEERKREEASRQEIDAFRRSYAEERARESANRHAALEAEAEKRGACQQCLRKTTAYQVGGGKVKFVRHRGRCPLER